MRLHSLILIVLVTISLFSTLLHAEDDVFLSVSGAENISKIRSITPLQESGNLLIVSNDDKCVRLRRSDDFALLDEFRFQIGKGRVGEITSNLDVSSDQKKFAIGRFGSRDHQSDIYVVQITPKKIIARLQTMKHRQPIHLVRFFDDNQKLVSVDTGGRMVIWNLQTQTEENNLRLSENAKISSISHVRKDKMLAGTTTGQILVLNPSPLKLLTKNKSGSSEILASFWTSDKEFITIDAGGTIRKFKIASNQIVKIREKALGTSSTINSITIDSQKKMLYFFFGKRLVESKNTDYSLRRFNFNLEQVDQPKEFRSIGVQSGTILAKRRELIVSRFSGDLEKWKLDPLKKMHTIPSAAKYKMGVAFDPKNIDPSDDLHLLWTVDPSVAEQSTAIGKVSKNAGFSLIASAKDGAFGLIQPRSSRRLFPYEFGGLKTDQAGATLKLMSNPNEPKSVYFVKVVNETPTTKLGNWEISSEMGLTINFMVLLSQKTALLATDMGTYLVNPRTGKLIEELNQQLAGVSAISFSPKRHFLATYSQFDRSIAIWGLKENPERPKYLATLKVFGDEWALVSANGFFDCTPAAEKFIGWHVNHGPREFASFHPLDKFSDKFHNPAYLHLMFLVQNERQVEKQLGIMNRGAGVKENIGPSIKILSPTASEIKQETSEKLKVVVEFKKRKSEVPGAIGLRINNRPPNDYYHDPISSKELADQEYEFEVTLKQGRQKIQAEVFSKNSKKSTVSDRAITANFESILGQKEPGGKLFFIGVGIDKYKEHPERSYGELSFCRSDVKAIGDTFKKGSQGAYVEAPEIEILTDLKSKAEFSTRLEAMLKDENGKHEFDETDTLVVMWSGHGDMTQNGEFHLVLPECQIPTRVDDRSLRKNGMSTTEMITELRDLTGAGNVILILDTCYSGGFVDEFKNSRKKFASEANDDEFGIMVIAAADSNQESKEPEDLKMSNFAFLLKHGLLGLEQFERENQKRTFAEPTAVRELDAGRIVTTDSLVKFLKKNISQLVETQTVRTNGAGDNNIFLARVNER